MTEIPPTDAQIPTIHTTQATATADSQPTHATAEQADSHPTQATVTADQADSPATQDTVPATTVFAPIHNARIRGRTQFAHLVDEADDALGLEATDDEKLRLGHWILGAWEDTRSCRTCDKSDNDVLACGKRTLVREDGIIRPVVMRCDKYYQVCHRRRIERLFGESQLGERFRHRTFDTFQVDDTNRRAYERAKELAASFAHATRGLLLAGGCGSGKTHLAAAIVHDLTRRGYRAVFLTSGRYLDSLKNAFGDREKSRSLQDEVRHANLLVLDDLGAEHISDWSKSELFALLNDRYEQLKPTVITTNLTLDALTARLGQRTVSRIAEMTDGAYLSSPDYRLKRYMK